jgi:hypothetical protein
MTDSVTLVNTLSNGFRSPRSSYHLAKKGFMSNYPLWHQYEEGYDLESEDPPLEVQNFYRLLVA